MHEANGIPSKSLLRDGGPKKTEKSCPKPRTKTYGVCIYVSTKSQKINVSRKWGDFRCESRSCCIFFQESIIEDHRHWSWNHVEYRWVWIQISSRVHFYAWIYNSLRFKDGRQVHDRDENRETLNLQQNVINRSKWIRLSIRMLYSKRPM